MGHRLRPKNPHAYHGKETSRPYFEGWYFKQVSGNHAFSIIPGVFRGRKQSDDFAFIQIIFGESKSYFFRYPYSEFRPGKDRFEVWIKGSFFSMDKVILEIAQDEVRIEAELFFSQIVPLKTTILSPSIMGPFSYLPAMQCNHGVLSLSHLVNGAINFGDNHIRLDDAIGYIEKDWGEAFPKNWIWMQCNDKKTSLMFSIASIPYGILHFSGLICVLRIEDKQYRFATYNGAKVLSIKKHGNKIIVEIKRGGYRLKICAYNKEFSTLKAPTITGMDRDIAESINAKYHVGLAHKKINLYSRNFENGGLEMLNPNKLIK